jgi:hypothetical protein
MDGAPIKSPKLMCQRTCRSNPSWQTISQKLPAAIEAPMPHARGKI